MRSPKFVVAALAAFALVGCASNDEADGYGHVSPEVIELYDLGDPGGMMELEIERSGRIREAEADLAIDRLPEGVLAAAKARAGEGAVVTGAEIEYGAAGKTFEVKLERNGVGMEFVVSPDGRVLESEREIDRAAAPQAVIDNGLAALPGTFKSVEVLQLADGAEEYHVKTTVGETSYKAVLRPDGTLLRAVREARAEIEVPLR